ncbi:unnamed protein product [Calicophoron daubneyi]|uniref:Ig-like domain-containing protein n=1 Tax=Calicophoron daubneyi TaxID=300641 RepID=A0AAV2TQL4_CALDB
MAHWIAITWLLPYMLTLPIVDGQMAEGGLLPDQLQTSDIIQLHPESQSVTLNSTVRLQCRVRILVDPQTGTGAQVYWSKNDFGIGGSREDIQEYGRSPRYSYSRYDLPYNLREGQYDLQITNVELFDEGAYVCQVNFMKQQYLSQTAVLTVQVPSEAPHLIQITQQGKGKEIEVGSSTPVVVEDGDNLVLRCVARHGKPGAHLSWLIDGVPVTLEPGHDPHTGVFRAGFTGNLTSGITPSAKFPRLMDSTSVMSARLNKLHHGKLIECRAENVGYEMHALRPAYTKLEVHYAPVVSIQIRPQRPNNEYMEHDIITVECTAHGRPDSFFWEWFVNGRQVENIADSWYRLRLGRNMHNAVFRCIAISNKKGFAETTVHVKFGPQFNEPSPLLFTASPGEDVALDCPARGNPTPRIDWRREGGHEVLHRGVTYRKNNLRAEDFGTYVCTAFVNGFPAVSKQMYIAKRKPPNVQASPVVHARLGRPAHLRCTVSSVPLPPVGQTHWFFNGRPVQSDSQHTFEREEFIGGVLLILHVAHVMTTDYGKYNCTVQNGYGSDWKIIELVHQEDFPLQFIIGAAVAIGILILIGLVLLCVCRQRVCGYRYKKGQQNQNSNQPSTKTNHSIPQDYGVVNTDFKSPTTVQESSFHQSFYPWFPSTSQPVTSYVHCNSDVDEQRSMNTNTKIQPDKQYFDQSKSDIFPNPTFSANISGNYCPPSCQFIQPLCNGGSYISTIDPRFLNSTQPTFLSTYPTVLSTGNMVNTSQPDFLPDTINLQTCGDFSPVINGSGCLFSTDGTVPHITTLDLTNGIPTQPSHSLYSSEVMSGRSSLEPGQENRSSNNSKLMCDLDTPRDTSFSGPSHSDFMNVNPKVHSAPSPSVSMSIQPDMHGVAYIINDHTTNV